MDTEHTKLPEKFEENYLGLHDDHYSDDTKKSRKNMMVITFIVLSLQYLEISITDIKFFGIELASTHEFKIRVIAFILLSYWYILYLAFFIKDNNLLKAKRSTLLDYIKSIKPELKNYSYKHELQKEIYGHSANETDVSKLYFQLVSEYEYYKSIQSKLGIVTFTQRITFYMHMYPPFILGVIAMYYIVN